jgi:excisionase family DNA binding protein
VSAAVPQIEDRALTPNQLARRLGVGVHTVLGWIRDGELAALNLARRGAGRPRWKILPSAIAAFEAGRTARPRAPVARRRRPVGTFTDYFGAGTGKKAG